MRTRSAHVIVDQKLRAAWKTRYWNMVNRCTKPTARDYPRYGGRGVAVHPSWVADPNEFYRYVVTIPGWDDRRLQLDRTDNEKGYEPGNLQMVSARRNMRNRRNTVWVTLAGHRMSLSDFNEVHCPSLDRNKVRRLLGRGFSPAAIAA